ncbi:IS3 family transposase, partial [Corynebacterium diphtheriae]|uniref:IS3 family transposase n=1 Tax=Corynebacterium diphtheriae TaxID=1717 RepID=UPI0034D767C8
NTFPPSPNGRESRCLPNRGQVHVYGRKWPYCDELEQAIHEYVDFYNEHRSKLEFDGLSINQRRRELLL